MSRLFVDTSGWANLVDQRQPFHQQAVQIYRKARTQKILIITSSDILSELVELGVNP